MQVLPCPFLSHLSPPQMVSLLTRWGHQYDKYLNPFWLRDTGNDVLAMFPKMAFSLLPPANKATLTAVDSTDLHSQRLRLQSITRKVLPDFQRLIPLGQDIDIAQVRIQLSSHQDINSLQQSLIAYMHKYKHTHSIADVSSSTQFVDGMLGFISYDLMAENLANASRTVSKDCANTAQRRDDYFASHQPLAYFAHYPLYLSCQQHQGLFVWQIHTTTSEASKKIEECLAWLKQLVKKNIKTRSLIYNTKALNLVPRWALDDYRQAFADTQDYLHAGDCYQINLTQEWQGYLPSDELLLDYLPKLDSHTQAPFAGYLRLQANNSFELLSCSPELFLTFEKNQHSQIRIITKPIKGTRPRGRNHASDQRLKDELANSEKDLAENVMIVDLLRNDMGKYAKVGTVRVPKRFAIESFSNVHHMVSTITATLKDDQHPLQMLFGSLPAGSITGTPKKRSVEIINELEGQPRGAYCGTMGYLNFDGTGQWNVLIRTLQAVDDAVSLWAGGGITVASECQTEYQECFDKVGNLLRVLAT